MPRQVIPACDPSQLIAFDTETHLFGAGDLATGLVCASSAVWWSNGPEGSLHPSKQEAIKAAYRILLREDAVIVGANIAYDFAVLANADPAILPLIMRALDEGRVWDVLIAQQLDAIAGGHLGTMPDGSPLRSPSTGKVMKRYSLELVTELMLGRKDAKENDTWRTSYALLEGVPVEKWPYTARQYPVDDAVNTLEVAVAQLERPLRNLDNLPAQCRAAFALHLGAAWGIRTDGTKVDKLAAEVEKLHAATEAKFQAAGFLRQDGTKDTAKIKELVERAYVGAPPRTPAGAVSISRDTLLESGDELLAELADNEPEKIRNTYLPFLREGVERPINLRPNVLVASGRTSYEGLIQLLPRGHGVRDCFTARPGYVFCSTDYSAIELCTFAQVQLWLFGCSIMAATINATGDPGGLHTAFGARLAGLTFEELKERIKNKDKQAKNYRQAAKAGNFGFGGGMGPAKFVFAKRSKSEGVTVAPDGTVYSGIRFCILLDGAERCGEVKVNQWNGRPCPIVCERCCKAAAELRKQWFTQWPEVKEYFDYVTNSLDNPENYEAEILSLAPLERVNAHSQVYVNGVWRDVGFTRVRGRVDFCNGANNAFQALAADGGKHALWNVVKECYTVPSSPLYGSRPIMFVHDEIFAEVPEDHAHEAATRLSEVMVESMREYTPDVTIKAEPALAKIWTKSMEAVYDANGRLIPWTPTEKKEK